MTTFQVNPSAVKVELRVRVGIDLLQTEGFDFDSYHENTAKHFEISVEEAEQRNLQEYSCDILFSGNNKKVKTSLSWFSHDRNESLESEPTGDDQQTIKDILNLLNEGVIKINADWDYSEDEEGNYVPFFIKK